LIYFNIFLFGTVLNKSTRFICHLNFGDTHFHHQNNQTIYHMARSSVMQSDFLKKRFAPFLLNKRARLVRHSKAAPHRRCPPKVQEQFVPTLPMALSTPQPSEMDCNSWTLEDAAEDFGASNANCNCTATVTLHSNVEDDKEYFTLDISSWDDAQKQEPNTPDNGCGSSSFGYVHEIDLYLAESEECSSCETELNEGLFASFDEAAPDDLACVEDSMCFTV
jgi:hypothetical protein